MYKNPIVALLLSFIPGVGHAYLGRPIRFLMYGGGFFGPLALIFFILVTNTYREDSLIIFLLFVAAVSWGINMLDMVLTLLSGNQKNIRQAAGAAGMMHESEYGYMEQQREKTHTMLMSIIPGLGHMSIGQLQRGITFLIAFLGLFSIVIFISIVTNATGFLIFLLGLPVIWIYSMFDAVQQLQRKQRGELLIDRPFFEEFENYIGTGKKNKALAATLSLFPGAGHLYLGQQKRGLQIMLGFLSAVYLMDSLRLTLFLFLLPLFWFFAFFDVLQQMSRYENSEMTDEAVIAQLGPYQKWIGAALLALGLYYLGDQMITSQFVRENWVGLYRYYMEFKYNLPTAVVAFVMIAAGLRLVFGGGWKALPTGKPPAPRSSDKEGRS